jgi:hypothetical protein
VNIVSELVQEGAGAGSELVKELMQGGTANTKFSCFKEKTFLIGFRGHFTVI